MAQRTKDSSFRALIDRFTSDLATAIAPKEPGEGEWRTKGLPQHGFPYAVATTSLRPDASAPTGEATTRTLDFPTTQVTGADVAVSPDGERLVFTILGHLYSVPVQGGTAEQRG